MFSFYFGCGCFSISYDMGVRDVGDLYNISTRPEDRVTYKCGNILSACIITNLFPAAHDCAIALQLVQ